MYQERRITPQDNEFRFIELADTFFQRSFPSTDHGYTAARKALIEQSKKVTPSPTTQELIRRNSEKGFFRKFETGITKALEEERYALALKNANQLYAYGEVDRRDFGSSYGIYGLSLKAHRTLADNVITRFSDQDQYLTTNSVQITDKYRCLKKRDDHGELMFLRRVIHRVALNWTLGDSARQQFDPFAVLRM